MPDRIVATFQPQVVVNDNYLDIGPAVPVDVTEAVLEIGEKAARAIEDDDYPADDLMPSSIFDWNKTKHGTDAAFRVTVEKAIEEYFEKHPTHHMIARPGQKGIPCCSQLPTTTWRRISPTAM